MAAFDTDTFLVREHVGFMKLHEAYDLLSADGKIIGTAVERASGWKKLLKLFVNKQMLGFTVEILNEQQQVLLTITRPFTILRSVVSVFDANATKIGYFRQHLLSLGGAFDVHDAQDKKIALLKGDWKGWNFKFTDDSGQEIGTVGRQWGGIAKELFTNADNYVVHIERSKVTDVKQVQLMLAAALCIDMVLKEHDG
ncbi:MAG TPA: phospholipid scramblase-related protein [Planctomycetota bacterium]|nr:phospholipid scramblase-related protein [Planctomycetota bacterium]